MSISPEASYTAGQTEFARPLFVEMATEHSLAAIEVTAGVLCDKAFQGHTTTLLTPEVNQRIGMVSFKNGDVTDQEYRHLTIQKRAGELTEIHAMYADARPGGGRTETDIKLSFRASAGKVAFSHTVNHGIPRGVEILAEETEEVPATIARMISSDIELLLPNPERHLRVVRAGEDIPKVGLIRRLFGRSS